MTSLALRAGAKLQNMTEWQYGLASKAPRWNVSGTYMQVLPRFVSVDEVGHEREFLWEYFFEPYEAMSAVFMKGYQWPFDVNKAREGSSVIDLLVYRECVMRGRRVYLDYTKNPFGIESIEFDRLSEEAQGYLQKADACFGTPIERLKKMNEPAYELYLSKGVDLSKEKLEIALCAQHCNGGIAVNDRWESNVRGLYAIGEAAGTHGITRPGGSALNSGQVGALRAAEAISASDRRVDGSFEDALKEALDKLTVLAPSASTVIDINARMQTARRTMSACAAAIRNPKQMERYQNELKTVLPLIERIKSLPTAEDIRAFYLLADTLTVQYAVLTSMMDFAKNQKISRGSALYTDEDGEAPEGLEDIFAFSLPESEAHKKIIRSVQLSGGELICSRRIVRKMPPVDESFETVWREFRERRG
jgi:succinate dehydrogenase/fumarate reductase flavoprotein subunit